MKINFRVLIPATLLLLSPLAMQSRSSKRGVSENEFQYKAQMEALAPGVSWYYNWSSSVGRYLANEEDMEFVPMCWNANYDADAIREYCASHPQTAYLLGFNEPNFTNQANMTPAAAAAAWPGVQALAKELGLQLVAPALNYSPNPPYQDPTVWMDEFVALVGNDAFDYLAVHCYGGFGVLKDLATTFHERYGKEIWVTEFCYWPEEGNPNSTVSQEGQTAAMMQMVEWLESTDWIFRYAWFKAIGESDASKGPNYGLLMSGKGENPRELSQQGLVYVNMGTFDSDVYNEVNTTVPASDYISQSNCLMGASNFEEGDSPIELIRFNAGASVDYNFDVPSAGNYVFELEVSGFGEPTRFDPTLGVFAVAADGSDGDEVSSNETFTLPGNEETYETKGIAVTLPAGKQTLRLKDVAPYSPSGIRIATVKLATTSGVEALQEVTDNDDYVNVYTLSGSLVKNRVKSSDAVKDLPAGFYIVGNRKVIVNN